MEDRICASCCYWMEIGMGWGVCQCHNDNVAVYAEESQYSIYFGHIKFFCCKDKSKPSIDKNFFYNFAHTNFELWRNILSLLGNIALRPLIQL